MFSNFVSNFANSSCISNTVGGNMKDFLGIIIAISLGILSALGVVAVVLFFATIYFMD